MPVKKRRSIRTLIALGFGYLVDQGESQAMGVLLPIIQALWGFNNTQFGLMETLRNITQTVSAPFWGYAADRFSRKKVLIFGTGVWGIWTVLVGLVPDFGSMLIVRAISGLGLGALMPATFSLLGDHYAQEKRGRALGFIGFVGLMGTVVGVLALGFVASPELWRWGFIGLGLASIFTGVLMAWLVEDLPRGSAEPELKDLITAEKAERYTINWPDVFTVLRIPTIWVAILQGAAGTMPWVVMSFFFIKWMVEELGYSNAIALNDPRGSAPLVFAIIAIGAAVGNMAGGFIGDAAEKRSQKYGRTIIGQISVVSGIPLMYYLLSNGPQMTFWQMFGLAFFTAFMISWPGRGAKEPMMQAVVPPELRSSAYSVVNLIEGGLSAFAGLIAGSLADRIGLTNALLWTIPFAWAVCAVIFTGLYFTYPRDAAHTRRLLAERRQELLAANGESQLN